MRTNGRPALVARIGARRFAIVILLVAFVVVPRISYGQSGATPISTATPPARISTADHSNRPAPASNDAIKVHGHWIIEVRNPDGKLTERREFENSLAESTGGNALADVLAQLQTLGGWAILLTKASCESTNFFNYPTPAGACPGAPCATVVGAIGLGPDPQGDPNTFYGGCYIGQTLSNAGATNATELPVVVGCVAPVDCSANLSVAHPPDGHLGVLQLSGSVAVSQPNGTIDNVHTILTLCPPPASSTACLGSSNAKPVIFTGVGLPSPAVTSPLIYGPATVPGLGGQPIPVQQPIPVSQGDIVSVTIYIFFS